MAEIHSTAIVHPRAELDETVSVGPYTVIGEHVRLGARTVVGAHCVIEGHTVIGCDNAIQGFCSLGASPQDKKYRGEPTMLEIGDRNTIREFCSFHIGTVQDECITRVGHDNWIMAYVHIAHDCRVGNHVIMANSSQLAGHVQLGDWAVLGGVTLVHQFVRVGAHSMSGIGSVLFQDVPPYVVYSGNTAKPYGINVEGLRRRGFSVEAVAAIRRAYRILFRQGLSLSEASQQINVMVPTCTELDILADFLKQPGRGIIR